MSWPDLGAYPVPICRLLVEGRDITSTLMPRLVSLQLTDNRGLEADQLDVTLSDHDGALVIPPHGAKLQLWLGWSDSGLIDKGVYVVDETEHSGAPDVLSIRARGVDLRAGFKAHRERSWHTCTLEQVLQDIATAYGLQTAIAPALGAQTIAHLDQANESDANLLTRLGQAYDALATVKADRLLFMPIGAATSVSGVALPHITLTRVDGDQHRYLQADRDSYSGVRAYYYDANSAEKKQAIAGQGDNYKDLRHTYADRDSALAAARAELQRLQRGSATLSYSLAKGRPELIPELTYSLQGVKDEIGAIVWLGGNVSHDFSSEAFVTRLELESKLPDGEEIAELATDEGTYTGVVAYYRDEHGGQKSVTQGDQTKAKRLVQLYANKGSAVRAVQREFGRLKM